jgi:hypothetical protein
LNAETSLAKEFIREPSHCKRIDSSVESKLTITSSTLGDLRLPGKVFAETGLAAIPDSCKVREEAL